jgi:hypothetical protein
LFEKQGVMKQLARVDTFATDSSMADFLDEEENPLVQIKELTDDSFESSDFDATPREKIAKVK